MKIPTQILDFCISCHWITGTIQHAALVKGVLLLSSSSPVALLGHMFGSPALSIRHQQTAVFLAQKDTLVCVFTACYLIRATGSHIWEAIEERKAWRFQNVHPMLYSFLDCQHYLPPFGMCITTGGLNRSDYWLTSWLLGIRWYTAEHQERLVLKYWNEIRGTGSGELGASKGKDVVRQEVGDSRSPC